ncbi:MAG: TIGR03617 family F420-dependent LLM class oxidoreductase [Nocardioidaceae bacterium]|nr:TIGR03617 family F420-dependent LLM class oxidoreductase [Nocardioidaceae bacterium]
MQLDLAFHGDPSRIAPLAAEAERRGVAGLFVAEAAHDPYIALTLASTTTTRIALGTSVAVAFARSPMSTAYSSWDLHRLSGGRLVLGLGSQIRPHITRRYAMPWSSPAARMREYVEALRAIWDAWQHGTALDFRGEFYQHTLMPPLFSPPPLDGPVPRVWVAGVGPRMVATAGAVGDGLICHPLLSRSYLSEVVRPVLGRVKDDFEVATLTMVATGRTEEDLAVAIASVRQQIGFYASTPAYEPVLAHHGWSGLHDEAHRLTTTGRWDELGDLVDDTVLATFAVVGDLPTAARGLRERFAGLAGRTCPSIPYDADDQLALDLVSEAGQDGLA